MKYPFLPDFYYNLIKIMIQSGQNLIGKVGFTKPKNFIFT